MNRPIGIILRAGANRNGGYGNAGDKRDKTFPANHDFLAKHDLPPGRIRISAA
jgi:hypothetical protein